MSKEDNISLAQYHVDQLWNKGNIDVCDELYADEFVIESMWPNPLLPGGRGDKEGAKRAARRWLDVFPDMVVSFDDVVADETKAVTVHTCTGTNQGSFMGRPVTGKPVNIRALFIHEIEDGKITHLWTSIDLLGILQQLGFAPTPPPIREEQPA